MDVHDLDAVARAAVSVALDGLARGAGGDGLAGGRGRGRRGLVGRAVGIGAGAS
ncbi:hypothetical protein M8Z33_02945 [Streptomyces sp. ZAF1911]|uniref:hypothetical protein n=1 Tax=Streptomyces sp. ZAF1911 TaxID=2944129 RepID=UPI00237A6908|nr:hypothetical protein [Streptomyces sp. ZAF1911]MDD9375647.1 hypothetical protein [Streptomyces sp. ZAF1911]